MNTLAKPESSVACPETRIASDNATVPSAGDSIETTGEARLTGGVIGGGEASDLVLPPASLGEEMKGAGSAQAMTNSRHTDPRLVVTRIQIN
ncbi:MAG: hypothetical protein AAF449_02270 [Myxococcota bacterium]